jgi:flagellar assembly factor FliW
VPGYGLVNGRRRIEMKIETSRFGEIDIDEESVVTMPEGMLGFSDVNQYVLIQHQQGSPFVWYQSVDEPNLAFLVTDPFSFFPEYQVLLSQEDIDVLGCTSLGDLSVFVVVVIPENPEHMTANLRGPVVINTDKHVARQIVLTDDRYSPHQPIIEEIKKRAEAQASINS